MQFECDPEKAQTNAGKHGVSFEEAITTFYDPLSATVYDPDHSEREHRYITVGYSSRDRLLVVAHAERGDNIRVISARPATPHERRRHERQSP